MICESWSRLWVRSRPPHLFSSHAWFIFLARSDRCFLRLKNYLVNVFVADSSLFYIWVTERASKTLRKVQVLTPTIFLYFKFNRIIMTTLFNYRPLLKVHTILASLKVQSNQFVFCIPQSTWQIGFNPITRREEDLSSSLFSADAFLPLLSLIRRRRAARRVGI